MPVLDIVGIGVTGWVPGTGTVPKKVCSRLTKMPLPEASYLRKS